MRWVLFLCFPLFYFNSLAQSIEWERNYPPPILTGTARIERLHSLSDTGFIACGTIFAADYFPEILIFDSAGFLTNRIPFRFSDSARGFAYDLVNIPNSDEFYFLGHSVSSTSSRDFICRLLPTGDTLWCTTYSYPGTLYRTILKGISLIDNSLITIGYRQYINSFLDIYFRRIDSLGNTLYEKNHSISGSQQPNWIIERCDGSVMVSSSTDDDHLLASFDIIGNHIKDTVIDLGIGSSAESSIVNYPDLAFEFAATNLLTWPNFNSKRINFSRTSKVNSVNTEVVGAVGLEVNSDSLLLFGSYTAWPDFFLQFKKFNNGSPLGTLNFPDSNNSLILQNSLLIGNNMAVLYGSKENVSWRDYWISKISGVGEPWIPDPCKLSPQAPGFSWTYDVGILQCIDTSFSGLQYHDSVYHYEWFTSNGFTSDSSSLFALWDTIAEPTIDVTLIIENFYQCKDTLTVTLSKTMVGIEAKVQDEIGINLFPNPAAGFLTLETVSEASQPLSGNIWLYDLNGMEILRSPIQKGMEKINVSNLSPGVYIARIEVNGVVVRRKVVKQ